MTEIPIGIVAILALVGAHILWVLLPLAPAVLIYWLFPNTPVAVSGPLSGLTVRTGGAFGAYLVVLLLTYGQLRTINQSIAMLDSRGLVHLKMGKLDNAIADYTSALEVQQKNASSLYGRGIANAKKGDEKAARADIEAAKAIDPDIEEDFKRYGVN